MLKSSQDQLPTFTGEIGDLTPELELHARCGVYTADVQAQAVLDAVGWNAQSDLASCSLLEPAAGNGAFVRPAVERLIASLRRHRHPLSKRILAPRIRAFEFIAKEAAAARLAVTEQLASAGVDKKTARELAKVWIRTADFLLSRPDQRFSHIVGNPPYCRWSKLPKALKEKYERVLPKYVTRGDVFLPFLDVSISLMSPDGVLGFVCSDRWKFMGFAEEFRATRMSGVTVVRDTKLFADQAFQRSVDAYTSLLVLKPRKRKPNAPSVIMRPTTLAEAGYRVKVGPALGCTPAYVLAPEEASSIESQLLAPFVDGRQIQDGAIIASGQRVAVMHDADGTLIDIRDYPRLAARLRRHRSILQSRSIVRIGGAKWYAPIDKVRRSDWEASKILVPELAKVPRFALDTSGMVPSHGVYAVFAPSRAALRELEEMWSEGALAGGLKSSAPQVKGGYFRCYKRFLDQLEAPT